MEKSKKKSMISLAITVVIILAGVIMTITQGFNFDLHYQGGKRIEIDIGKTFDIKDIQNISEEVLGKEAIAQTVEVYEQTVSVFAKDITEEQRQEIITKINEKYGLELKAEDSEFVIVPHTRLRDILKPYAMPLIITTIIILIYTAIRYIKKAGIQILFETILSIIFGQALLFSIIAITRIPISQKILPIILVVYVLSTVFYTIRLEDNLAKEKAEEEKVEEK